MQSHCPSPFYPRCTRDEQTRVELNGASQEAHFSFEAFRFVEHKNQTISTFYLHCVTRLCEVSSCSGLLPVSKHQSSRSPNNNNNCNITNMYFLLLGLHLSVEYPLILNRIVEVPKRGERERPRMCRPTLQSPRLPLL